MKSKNYVIAATLTKSAQGGVNIITDIARKFASSKEEAIGMYLLDALKRHPGRSLHDRPVLIELDEKGEAVITEKVVTK